MQRENNQPSLLRLGSISSPTTVFTTSSSASDSDAGPTIFTDPCCHCGNVKRKKPSLLHQESPTITTNKKIFVDPSSIKKDPTTTPSHSFATQKLKGTACVFSFGSVLGSSGSPNKSEKNKEDTVQVQTPEEKKILTTTSSPCGVTFPGSSDLSVTTRGETEKWKKMKESLEEMHKWMSLMIQEQQKEQEEEPHIIIPCKEEDSHHNTNKKKDNNKMEEENVRKEEKDLEDEDHHNTMAVIYECSCGKKYQIGLGNLSLSIHPISSD